MNTDLEELLTAQMRGQAQATAWRPELLDGALRRHKARRIRGRLLFPVLAVGVAAAVAVSVALAAPNRTAAPAKVAPNVQTVGYVVSRAKSAITAAAADVLEVRTQTSNGWSYTLWFEIHPVLQLRVAVANSSGRTQEVFANGSRMLTLDFQTRTWWSVPLPPSMRGKHVTLMVPGSAFMPLLAVSAAGVSKVALPTPQNLRAELTDGAFRLVGTGTVAGTRVLHLQGDASSNRGVNMWVSSATYLPVRSSVRIRVQTGKRIGWLQLSSRLTWMPATAANLALLKPGIPAGFRHQAPQCPCG